MQQTDPLWTSVQKDISPQLGPQVGTLKKLNAAETDEIKRNASSVQIRADLLLLAFPSEVDRLSHWSEEQRVDICNGGAASFVTPHNLLSRLFI